MPVPTWTIEDSQQAQVQGWDVFAIDCNAGALTVQRLDEMQEFDSDWEALGYVALEAISGSELHRKALRVIGLPILGE